MFFSVKKSIKLAGKAYIPCICYPCPRFLELTVKSLEEKGIARIHNEYVSFQNGKIIETKENVTKTQEKVVKTEETVKVKKSKKKNEVKEIKDEDIYREDVKLDDSELEEF